MRGILQNLPIGSRQASPAWWQWPSVLSLEVPLIAVLWQRLLGNVLETPVPLPKSLLLGLAVWLIYSADRLLDGFGPHPGSTERHRFYIVHRRSVTLLWLLVGFTTLGLALVTLTRGEWVGGALLTTAMLGYFFSRHRKRPDHHPKELHIASLFALGVSLVPLLSGASTVFTTLCAALFAFLISLNCGFLALWEEGHDLEPVPFFTRYPRVASQLPALALAFTLGSFLLAFLLPGTRPFTLALSSSSLLLYGLDGTWAARLGPEARRVAGDAALLTPLLFLLLYG